MNPLHPLCILIFIIVILLGPYFHNRYLRKILMGYTDKLKLFDMLSVYHQKISMLMPLEISVKRSNKVAGAGTGTDAEVSSDRYVIPMQYRDVLPNLHTIIKQLQPEFKADIHAFIDSCRPRMFDDIIFGINGDNYKIYVDKNQQIFLLESDGTQSEYQEASKIEAYQEICKLGLNHIPQEPNKWIRVLRKSSAYHIMTDHHKWYAIDCKNNSFTEYIQIRPWYVSFYDIFRFIL